MSFVFNFKDPATVYSYSLISVHHDVMWFLILILSIVYWSLYKIIKDSNWLVFNKQSGFFLLFFSFIFFFIEVYFFSLYIILLQLTLRLRSIVEEGYFFALNNLVDFVDDNRFLNVWLQKFYYFHAGLEDAIGYSFNNVPFSFNETSSFNFIDFYNETFDLFAEKYVDYFLFNRLSLGYYYNNDVKNENLFLDVQKFHHSTNFEFICASFPSIIILLILIPSTLLLYSLDEELEPLITYKVLGHQWYWSYEFNNWFFINDEWKKVSYNFDSSMLVEDNLEEGDRRLLEVDKPLVVPVNVPLRFLITSMDVLHSWAVPELGIKIDATPGRLCHYLILVRRPGVFYGQCSELCGVAHGFMPIVIKAV